MTTKGHVVNTAGTKGSGEIKYSLADCEEGRVRKQRSSSNQFKYPANEYKDNNVNRVKPPNESHLFKWHYTDETDCTNITLKPFQLQSQSDCQTVKHTKTDDLNTTWKYDQEECEDINQNIPNKTMANSHLQDNDALTRTRKFSAHRYSTEKSGESNDSKQKLTQKTFQTANCNDYNNVVQLNKFTVPNRLDQSVVKPVDKDYPHLSQQEVFLLKKGMSLYKSKEYIQALECYNEGYRLNPAAKEFQHLKLLCEKKLTKKAEKKKLWKTKETTPTEKKTSICWSGSHLESQEMLSSRQQYLLQQAEQCLSHGDFQGCFNYCEKGLQMLPTSKAFQKAKDSAYEGILISLGIKAASDDFEQNLIIMKLIKAQQFLHDKEYDKAIEQCKTVMHNIHNMTSQQLPQRSSLLATAFTIMGTAHANLDNYKKALSCHLQELDNAIESNTDETKAKALTNVGRIYAKMKQYEKAIILWKQIFELGIDAAIERSWLYHEIGQCYLELKDFENTTKYAEMSLKAAFEANQADRKVTASLLEAHAALRKGSAQDSKIAFGRALYFAIEEGDFEAKASIETAIREIDAVMKE